MSSWRAAVAAGDKSVPKPGSLQWVVSWWNWRQWRLTFFRFPPQLGLSIVYEWCLYAGPLQVRRWVPDPPAALARYQDARFSNRSEGDK